MNNSAICATGARLWDHDHSFFFGALLTRTMQMWLLLMTQCVLSVSVIGVSVRLCMGDAGPDGKGRGRTVSSCLKLCLAWVGAVGGAAEVPVNMMLSLRIPQCMYTCITLVCCPLLIRQFTVSLLLLLILTTHLQYRVGPRFAHLVTRQRILFLVFLSWVCSVLTAFAQFIIYNSFDTWQETSQSEMGLEHLWPNHTSPKPPPKLPYPQEHSVIGKHLPYGGFLSKFMVEDLHNFTYKEIHSRHWGVCAPDTLLSPAFLVYVYAVAVFLVPVLILLAVLLDLMCLMPWQVGAGPLKVQKKSSGQTRALVLSLSFLILLCLPLHIIHFMQLFCPRGQRPMWVIYAASILFQAYSLVPPLLFTQSPDRVDSVAVTPLTQVKTTSSKVEPKSLNPLEFLPPEPAPKGATP